MSVAENTPMARLKFDALQVRLVAEALLHAFISMIFSAFLFPRI